MSLEKNYQFKNTASYREKLEKNYSESVYRVVMRKRNIKIVLPYNFLCIFPFTNI